VSRRVTSCFDRHYSPAATDEWIAGYNAFLRDRRGGSASFAQEWRSFRYREGYYTGLRLYGLR